MGTTESKADVSPFPNGVPQFLFPGSALTAPPFVFKNLYHLPFQHCLLALPGGTSALGASGACGISGKSQETESLPCHLGGGRWAGL